MKKNILPIILCAWCLLMILSSCSVTRNLNRELDKSFKTSEIFRKGFAGLMVYDPATGEILYEYNSEKYFTPASNIKLLTFYAGITTLGDSVPALKYEIRNDSLIFTGTGDPSFLHEEFPYSQVFSFLRQREEHLYFAPPLFKEKAFGPGWAWDDYNWDFSAERGAFPIYGNRVSFNFAPADSVKIHPEYFRKRTQVNSSSIEVVRPKATREFSENRFTAEHVNMNQESKQLIPFRYSSDLVVELMQDTLGRKIGLLKERPANYNPIKTLYSVPTDSLYKKMLQESDNFIAEQILLMTAGIVSDTLKSGNAIEHVKDAHLFDLPDDPKWVDGSGLSRYNLVTPRSLVRVLEKISREVPAPRLFNLMPSGGVSGTLKEDFVSEKPYLFAKTGTLSNTYNLSGFLKTKRGRLLIFSFMNNNHMVPTALLKQEMEIILKRIRDNY